MGIFLILLYVLFLIAGPWFTMTLWNWLMPEIFNLPIITYWQALGLMTLSSLLFYRPSSSNK